MNYKLTIEFQNEKSETLYEGLSYLRKNLSDSLLITENKIELSFSRTKKIGAEQLFTTANSLIRYEIQKALCFYIAVTGTLPEVSRFIFTDKSGEHEVKHEHFTATWAKCDMEFTLPKEKISLIFSDGDHAKDLYVSLTYFIKAQIDQFPNDCYRSAWTGINSIYRVNRSSDNESEKNQIKKMRERMRNMELNFCANEIVQTSDDFWKRLDWFHYMQKNKLSSAVSANNCRDSLVLGYITKIYERSVTERVKTAEKNLAAENNADAVKELASAKEQKKEFEKAKKQINQILTQERTDINDRICFLVCDYCYMLRNRYFHAAKAYPVFIIDEGKEMAVEEELTRILLLCMKDFILDSLFNTI